jgi:protein O-GlcNAc transferase
MNDLIVKARRLWVEGSHQESILLYQKLIKNHPTNTEILTDITSKYFEIGQMERCYELSQRLENLKPDLILAKYYQAFCLFQRQKMSLSRIKIFEILRIDPKHKKSLILLCQILFLLKLYDSALKINLKIQDEELDTLEQRASIYVELGRSKKSNEMYKNLWERCPERKSFSSNYLQTLLYLDDGSNEFIRTAHLEIMNKSLSTSNDDFASLSLYEDRFSLENLKKRKIRIGYVSCNLYNHPVSNCLLPIVENHNRQDFEVILFAIDNQKSDDVTQRFKKIADGFFVLPPSPSEAYQYITSMCIDILVDTIGHTGNHILPLFQKRLAPIQISMIGYCGPSGISNMDYVVIDEYTVPSDNIQTYNYFNEALIHQSPIFAPYQPLKRLPPCMRKKKPFGLRFGSTHKIPKISTNTIRMWSSVLHHIPYATLCLYRDCFCEGSIQNIIEQFRECGIEENQLEFHSEILQNKSSHLEIYQEIDFLLDTQPWSGHITACESLLMGVPIITLAGKNHAGRMVASILQCLGREEWIVPTPNKFAECVVSVVDNWNANQRKTLRKQFLKSHICNGSLYTQNFEAHLQHILKTTKSKNPLT